MRLLFILFSFLFINANINANTTERNLESFNELKVNAGIEVNLIQGGKHAAEVYVKTGSEEDVLTMVENGVLRVRWKEGKGQNRKASVKIHYTSLESISTYAGGKVTSGTEMLTENLNLSANSGGAIKLDVVCVNLAIKLNSGGTINLEGKTTNQNIRANSGSSYRCPNLVAQNTDAKSESGASIIVNTTRNLQAEASSGGSVKYKGEPTNKDIKQSKYSGGSVKAF